MDRAFQSKVGLLLACPTKDSQLEQVRVELQQKTLVVMRHDMVYEDVMANYDVLEEKRVLLERSDDGGLGISIQGGMDYKCPVKVYKVIENSPAAKSGQIEEGKVILHVNDTSMWGKTHDEAAELLRSAGKCVTVHLAKLELKNAEGPEMVAYTEEKWIPLAEIPLTLALVTCFQKGTAILRPNAFQVMGRDGRSKVNLHCDDRVPHQLREWTTAISERIRELNHYEMEQYNAILEENEQVVLMMSWVHEHLPSAAHTKVWQRKFLVLRKMQLQIFASPPESFEEWFRPEKSYKLLEMTIRVLKPHELPEQRANSILLTSGTGNNHVISLESHTSLESWTQTIHNTTVGAVLHLEKQQYLGTWKGQNVYFSLDITEGFMIYDRANMSVLWKKQFYLLKNSSDDGHSNLSLQFRIQNSQLTETQELELEDLQIAVCGMECFLAAKVTMLDPQFISQKTDLVA